LQGSSKPPIFDAHIGRIATDVVSERMVPNPAVTVLDVVHLRCPLPVLKARKVLAGLAPGAVLEVLASDPGAVEDFAAFCGLTGHRLIDQSSEGTVLRFRIQKAAEAP
jgi:tRNA 2-thiouridine synthesizing protein A